jgi:hypothetical protein
MIYETRTEYVFVYVRNNEWFSSMGLYKVGVSVCLVERANTYKTSEPIPGDYVLVIKVFGDKVSVDNYLKQELLPYHRSNGGGTEFYCKSVLENIVPYIARTGLKYDVLTQEDIAGLERTKYERSSTPGPGPKPLPLVASIQEKMCTIVEKASTNSRKVLESSDWNPKANKYMVHKVNSMGGKSVTLISSQTSRSLHLNTPLMMTWGISDFANDDGTSDGKFKISLNFPNAEYSTPQTDSFLQKMIEFQKQVVDDAVTNSELWFGKKKSKELVEDSFFPFLKYPKTTDANGKSTRNLDMSRPPSMSANVPVYKGDDGSIKWECDLFDINYNQIFPAEDDEGTTPVDLVPKLSKIACTLQCTGIWIGGKGWGLTWKFISGLVKPKQNETLRDKCQFITK